MATTQPFPPGMSRLERLPDELKLRVGYYLTDNDQPEFERFMNIEDIRHFQRLFGIYPSQDPWDESNMFGDRPKYDDSVLALASTSTRLCDVFLVEHSKKYGLQNTLHRSIELGMINLVQRAVDYGADINQKSEETTWQATALQIAVKFERLPIVLYLLRRGVDKVDELIMDVLRDRNYDRGNNSNENELVMELFSSKNRCRCKLLHALMDATLGSHQASHTSHTGPLLPVETLEALVPTGQHLWFIFRTCMRHDWMCDCGGDYEVGVSKDVIEYNECPMRLISLLRRHGARWMPCGPFEDTPEEDDSWYYSSHRFHDDWEFAYGRRYNSPRGFADVRRFLPAPYVEGPVMMKPSVAGVMHRRLLGSTAYRRDHCVPFLVSMLEHGVTAEQGDLADAMDLASEPDTKQLSIAIVVALLRAGTNPNEHGVMKTAMRLACMYDTKDAAVAFVTLLLEHGADPSVEEMQDEIQGAAEKWWIQSTWQSSGVFGRIMGLLVEGGLDEHIGREILAVLGLDHDYLAKVEGDGPAKV